MPQRVKRSNRENDNEEEEDTPERVNLAYRLPGDTTTRNTIPDGTMIVWDSTETRVEYMAIPSGNRSKRYIIPVDPRVPTGKPSENYQTASPSEPVSIADLTNVTDPDDPLNVSRVKFSPGIRSVSNVTPSRIRTNTRQLSSRTRQEMRVARRQKQQSLSTTVKQKVERLKNSIPQLAETRQGAFVKLFTTEMDGLQRFPVQYGKELVDYYTDIDEKGNDEINFTEATSKLELFKKINLARKKGVLETFQIFKEAYDENKIKIDESFSQPKTQKNFTLRIEKIQKDLDAYDMEELNQMVQAYNTRRTFGLSNSTEADRVEEERKQRMADRKFKRERKQLVNMVDTLFTDILGQVQAELEKKENSDDTPTEDTFADTPASSEEIEKAKVDENNSVTNEEGINDFEQIMDTSAQVDKSNAIEDMSLEKPEQLVPVSDNVAVEAVEKAENDKEQKAMKLDDQVQRMMKDGIEVNKPLNTGQYLPGQVASTLPQTYIGDPQLHEQEAITGGFNEPSVQPKIVPEIPKGITEDIRQLYERYEAIRKEVDAARDEKLAMAQEHRFLANQSAEVKLSNGALQGTVAPIDPKHSISNTVSETIGIAAHENNKRRDQAVGSDSQQTMIDELTEKPLSEQQGEQIGEQMDTNPQTTASSANAMEQALTEESEDAEKTITQEKPEQAPNLTEFVQKQFESAKENTTGSILSMANAVHGSELQQLLAAKTDEQLLTYIHERIPQAITPREQVMDAFNRINADVRAHNQVLHGDILTQHGEVQESQIASSVLNPSAKQYINPIETIEEWASSTSNVEEQTPEEQITIRNELQGRWNTFRTETVTAAVAETSATATRLFQDPTSSVRENAVPHADQSHDQAVGNFLFWNIRQSESNQQTVNWDRVGNQCSALGLEPTPNRMQWLATGNADGNLISDVHFKEEDLEEGPPNKKRKRVLDALASQVPLPQEQIPPASYTSSSAPKDESSGPHKFTPTNVPTSSDRDGFINNIPDPRFSEIGGKMVPNVKVNTKLNPKFDPKEPESKDNPRLIHEITEDRFAGAHQVMGEILQAEADRLLQNQPFAMYAPIHAQPVDRFLGVKNYRRLNISIVQYMRDFSQLSIAPDDIDQMYKWNLLALNQYGQYLYSFAGYETMVKLAPIYTPKTPKGVQQEFMELQEMIKEVKAFQLASQSRAERVGEGDAGPSRPIEKHLDDFFRHREQAEREKLFDANSLIIAVNPGTTIPDDDNDSDTGTDDPVEPSKPTMDERPTPYQAFGMPKKPVNFGVDGLKTNSLVGRQEMDMGIQNKRKMGTTGIAQPIASEQYTRQQFINTSDFKRRKPDTDHTRQNLFFKMVNGRR